MGNRDAQDVSDEVCPNFEHERFRVQGFGYRVHGLRGMSRYIPSIQRLFAGIARLKGSATVI